MRAVIQRVLDAKVIVDDRIVGNIGPGLLVLLGVQDGDSESDVVLMAEKIASLRCFADENGKFNRSVQDIKGSILVVSQFTLLGDCRKGRRPSFTMAAQPLLADKLYTAVVDNIRERGIHTETGEFGAHMKVSLVNDGPVTFLLDSRRVF